MLNKLIKERNGKRLVWIAVRRSSSNYQFLQESKLSTMHFQKSLPRLTIPLLQKSCERYLNAVQPIVSEKLYFDTKKDVDEFHNGVGVQLDQMLRKKDKMDKNSSYISEPWFDMYLRDRAPLPLNYNPLIVMNNDTRPQYCTQLVRATNLVISSLRFWKSLRAEILEPEIYHMDPQKTNTDTFKNLMRIVPSAIATYAAYAFKAFPLDMSQYHRLFGLTRIPKIGKDELTHNPDAKHIVVLRRGNMYAVDVLDDNGNIESPSTILSRIKNVINLDDKEGTAAVPLGVLTSGNRDKWAKQREYLENEISSNNRDLLRNVLDSALFCLCLESSEDFTNDETKATELYKHLLASDGKNRWFDKSISLIVIHDGTAAVNFEHSWGDGVAVLRYFNEVYKDSLNNSFVSTETPIQPDYTESVRKLKFDFDDKLTQMVKDSYEANKKIIDNLEMNILTNSNLHKGLCKESRVSPDAMMQLAFQLAYRLVYGSYVGSYESCSTAAFRFGRTETIRPCTMATKNFCEEIANDSKRNYYKLFSMLKECSSLHGQLTKEAAMGQGFDRHFFAMKNIASKENIPIPNIFENEASKKLNKCIISTSTLSSEAIAAGGFGPVVQEGFGLGYSIRNDLCGSVMTSYKDKRNLRDLMDGLDTAFKTIAEVMSSSKKQ